MATVSSNVGFAVSGFDATFLQSLWPASHSALACDVDPNTEELTIQRGRE